MHLSAGDRTLGVRGGRESRPVDAGCDGSVLGVVLRGAVLRGAGAERRGVEEKNEVMLCCLLFFRDGLGRFRFVSGLCDKDGDERGGIVC